VKLLFKYLAEGLAIERTYCELDGLLIERWILKTVVNLVYYYASIEAVAVDSESALPYLYGDRQFVYQFGLSVAFSLLHKANFLKAGSNNEGFWYRSID
jgi:hypothetical protein